MIHHCPGCQSPVDEKFLLCPECGALLPKQAQADERLWSRSRLWDRVIGVVAALATMISVCFSAEPIAVFLRRIGLEAMAGVAIPALFVLAPLFSWLGFRKRYPVVGHAYLWTIAALVIAIILMWLGMLILCIIRPKGF